MKGVYLEATGIPSVLRQSIDAIGVLGKCGIVGAAKLGAEASCASPEQ